MMVYSFFFKIVFILNCFIWETHYFMNMNLIQFNLFKFIYFMLKFKKFLNLTFYSLILLFND